MMLFFPTRLAALLVVALLLSPNNVVHAQRQLDHFLLYRLADPISVSALDDVQVEHGPDVGGPTYRLDLLNCRAFANPVVKTPADSQPGQLIDENHHLAIYDFQGATAPEATVKFINQFGPQEWVLGDPIRLLVPAKKNEHQTPAGLDHFLAYDVFDVTQGVERDVRDKRYQLVDQWQELTVRIRRPAFFCLPVIKHHNNSQSDIQRPTIALAVYAILPRPALNGVTARIQDQFDDKSIIPTVTQQLAVPSTDVKVEWK